MKQLPQQLLNDLQCVTGFDEPAFVRAHQQSPLTSVRLHPMKGEGLFATEQNVQWCAAGRYLPERPVFTLDPLFHAGAYYVQEASSMFLAHMLRSILPDMDNLRILDLCAAPGGKSTLIASMLGPDSLLVSNEVIRSRAPVLEENLTRWGYMNTWVCSNDAAEIGRLDGYFDIIVVDAPCSGSGLFRKDENAIDEWSEANVQLCSQRQQRILADIWPALKEDGILIYATCSYSPQEDEEILDWLDETFSVEGKEVDLSESWGIVSVVSKRGMHGYRFFPDKVKGEGFFIAALQKKDAAATSNTKFRTVHDKKIHEQAAYLLDGNGYSCIKTGDSGYSAIKYSHEVDFQILSKAVFLRQTGLPLGTPTAKEWLPSHNVALSVNRSSALPLLNVSKEQALRFLKKEEISVSNIAKGWYLISYNGLALGWVKSLGNRFNNYLPKHWRIRIDIPADEA